MNKTANKPKRVWGYAWITVGTDDHPQEIAWYRDQLRKDLKVVRVKLVHSKAFKP